MKTIENPCEFRMNQIRISVNFQKQANEQTLQNIIPNRFKAVFGRSDNGLVGFDGEASKRDESREGYRRVG